MIRTLCDDDTGVDSRRLWSKKVGSSRVKWTTMTTWQWSLPQGNATLITQLRRTTGRTR